MSISITLTANAGVLISADRSDSGLAIDALHSERAAPFSTLTPAMTERVLEEMEQRHVRGILATHQHPDHFDPALVASACIRIPGAEVFLPWTDGRDQLTIGDWNIRAGRLPHRFARDEERDFNYGFLLEAGGVTLFTPGDADPCSAEMKSVCATITPDIALLPFMWLTLPRHREMLHLLNPGHVVVFHLPFEEDDEDAYTGATMRVASKNADYYRVLNRFMQTTEFSI